MPTSWVVGSRPRLLSPEQIVRLEVAVNKRLGLDVKTLRNFDGSAWLPISRQIDADVQTHVKASRIETFNGNYGLNRVSARRCWSSLSAACWCNRLVGLSAWVSLL